VTFSVAMVVNGTARSLEVEPRRLLVHVLRDDLSLTGTHIGCDTSQCGACTVMVDGRAVKSCTMLAVQADGSAVTTIEGLAPAGEMHPLQAAFWAKHGLQCGFCTPGMIMTAVDFLEHSADPSDEEIRHAIEGNFCRCTGYQNIVAAIKEAAGVLRAGSRANIPVGGDGEKPLPPISEEEGAAPAGPVAEEQETSPSGSSR
jgi:aerobic carbon-monoxide dehydrogenase small subunit